MFNDYGQSYDRQGFRKDFNPELTLKEILSEEKYIQIRRIYIMIINVGDKILGNI